MDEFHIGDEVRVSGIDPDGSLHAMFVRYEPNGHVRVQVLWPKGVWERLEVHEADQLLAEIRDSGPWLTKKVVQITVPGDTVHREFRPGDRVAVYSQDGERLEGVVECVGPWPWPVLEPDECIVLRELPPMGDLTPEEVAALDQLKSGLSDRGTPDAFPVKIPRSRLHPVDQA